MSILPYQAMFIKTMFGMCTWHCPLTLPTPATRSELAPSTSLGDSLVISYKNCSQVGTTLLKRVISRCSPRGPGNHCHFIVTMVNGRPPACLAGKTKEDKDWLTGRPPACLAGKT